MCGHAPLPLPVDVSEQCGTDNVPYAQFEYAIEMRGKPGLLIIRYNFDFSAFARQAVVLLRQGKQDSLDAPAHAHKHGGGGRIPQPNPGRPEDLDEPDLSLQPTCHMHPGQNPPGQEIGEQHAAETAFFQTFIDLPDFTP